MHQINLHIKSFDPYYIQESMKKINSIVSLVNLSYVTFFTLPKHLQKITLLKSPHIDKKSKEQFEIKNYKSILYLNTKNIQNIYLLIYMLKNSEFSGVEIQIFTKYSTFFKYK